MCIGHDARDTAAGSAEEVTAFNRRGFLRAAAVGAAVVGASGALATPAVATGSRGGGGGLHRIPQNRISIQLYTVRNQLAIDFAGTLATLAAIGYGGLSMPASSVARRLSSRRRWMPLASGRVPDT
jgi:hypothetical protein